jgi:hypothetical protein
VVRRQVGTAGERLHLRIRLARFRQGDLRPQHQVVRPRSRGDLDQVDLAALAGPGRRTERPPQAHRGLVAGHHDGDRAVQPVDQTLGEHPVAGQEIQPGTDAAGRDAQRPGCGGCEPVPRRQLFGVADHPRQLRQFATLGGQHVVEQRHISCGQRYAAGHHRSRHHGGKGAEVPGDQQVTPLGEHAVGYPRRDAATAHGGRRCGLLFAPARGPRVGARRRTGHPWDAAAGPTPA